MKCGVCGQRYGDLLVKHGQVCEDDPDFESQWQACGACGEWNNPSQHNCSEEVVNA